MRHRAVNKKLIFFSCIRIPASLWPPHSSHLAIHSFLLFPSLSFPVTPLLLSSQTNSIANRQGSRSQLYSYKRKLHQQLPITFLFRFSRTRLLLIVAGRPPDALSRSCAGDERTLPFQRNATATPVSNGLSFMRCRKERCPLSLIIVKLNQRR